MIFKITYCHWIKDRALDIHISVIAVDHIEAEDWVMASQLATDLGTTRDAVIHSIEDVATASYAPMKIVQPKH
jgi:hypothetical protein